MSLFLGGTLILHPAALGLAGGLVLAGSLSLCFSHCVCGGVDRALSLHMVEMGLHFQS